MKCKTIVLGLLITCSLNPSWGQTDLIVKFNKNENVAKTKKFRFSLHTSIGTTLVCSSINRKEIKEKIILAPLHSDTLTGIFEFTIDNKTWSAVEYCFHVKTNTIRRIEINLSFRSNDRKREFLQDFTVDQYYDISSVTIQSEKLKVGSHPIFILVSNSDTTFWGVSSTNHFYGTIKTKTEFGWYDFSGSYCRSTVPEKTLTKGDTVFSWIPNYSPGDEYKIKRSGKYKYVVAMALEKFSEETSAILIATETTRKRTRIFYEVETEFTVE